MTREDIFAAAEKWINDGNISIADFAIEQINLALEEAAALIDGVGAAEHNDATKIRELKIK
jgi:hypothetical protein